MDEVAPGHAAEIDVAEVAVAGVGAARPRRVPRDSIEYGCGYFKLRLDYFSLDAHCFTCGAKIDKSIQPFGGFARALMRPNGLAPGRRCAQGRPMGRHCLWLEWCPGNATDHMAMARGWEHSADLAYEPRRAARRRARRTPDLEGCFAAEDDGAHRLRRLADGSVTPADGSDGEPFDLC